MYLNFPVLAFLRLVAVLALLALAVALTSAVVAFVVAVLPISDGTS